MQRRVFQNSPLLFCLESYTYCSLIVVEVGVRIDYLKNMSIRRQLFIEFGKQGIISVCIFSALFLLLFAVECLFPTLQGTLLQWQDPAFVVGIPASVIGTAYVLTIRNPKNYVGFYGGILMSILLAIQFYLQGNYDLVVLYLAVFVPFGLMSLITWRRNTLQPKSENQPFIPEWLPLRTQGITIAIALCIVALDYVLATMVIQQNAWSDAILLKLMGGLMIASSVLANFLLIRQKIDAWLWWVIYSLSGIIFYVLIGNMFSLVLFCVFLLVNGSAGIAWIRLRQQYIRH